VFDVGCFLNFGVDHIGENEHVDEEDYFTSKLKFFDQCALVCLNAETDGLERILDRISRSGACKRLVLFSPSGLEACKEHAVDYAACDIHMRDGLTEFCIRKRTGQGSNVWEDAGIFSLSIRGLFNVENALAAAVVAFELGLPVESIRQGLLETSVAGRMEVFENEERHVVVIVDYAHNRMSFERLYASTKKEYPGWRIEAIFGCPGGKGLQRREELPDIAAYYADFTWITEEDAGEEDVLAISVGLAKRLAELGAPARIVLDREEAIRTAIEGAAENTVIVMTGKGRENYQKRGTEYVPVESDVELVAKYLWK
jgi:UDP-N-acetylmuramoyl-L-alanyl-D-glutamate--2,6-diaminopimelate ligase